MVVGSSSVGLGLFSGETDDGCETYSDGVEFNAADQVGRAFGVLTNLLLVFAFVGTFLMIFVLKEKAARMVWTIARILFVLALLSVLITFAGVATELCIDDDVEVDMYDWSCWNLQRHQCFHLDWYCVDGFLHSHSG